MSERIRLRTKRRKALRRRANARWRLFMNNWRESIRVVHQEYGIAQLRDNYLEASSGDDRPHMGVTQDGEVFQL